MKTDVFKALADAQRRRILDLLRSRDGRSLQELTLYFRMSRFGVMKHLRVLERAGLVVAKKEGRFALHYLNAVPIQRIADRWISRFSKPWAAALVDLKSQLEKGGKRGRKN
ncbi:MAG: Activator of Hsp90 ATPase 1 family [Planctomycetota bacterium]|nr:MAG: Activator of Hsp90 ATPase 1 family [Planctomycetota bacterium]